MKALGCHIVAEMSLCDPEILSDLEFVQRSMIKAAEVANAEVREVAFHRFTPHGVSGVVVISESHLSIHTWPEIGYAAVDIYTCGAHTDPALALQYLCGEFRCTTMTTSTIQRGLLNARGAFGHQITTSRKEEEAFASQGA